MGVSTWEGGWDGGRRGGGGGCILEPGEILKGLGWMKTKKRVDGKKKKHTL